MKQLTAWRAQRGFTMIEAIVAIVVIGILGAIVAVFIRMPVQGYADSVARAEVSDEADLALRRMARDLRLALPNSIRVSADHSAVEFLLTKAGGRYLSSEDGVADAPVLDFLNPASTSFTVAGAGPAFAQQVGAGDFVVVYNLGENLAPSDAYQFAGAQRNIALIDSVSNVAGAPVINLADNPFASQSPPMPSPSQRFQVISGPVSYVCAREPDGALALSRQSGYAISAQHNVPPRGTVSKALIASHVAHCGIFEYNSAQTQPSALVILTLELTARNEDGATIRLVHQVHVDNTP